MVSIDTMNEIKQKSFNFESESMIARIYFEKGQASANQVIYKFLCESKNLINVLSIFISN